MEKLSDAYWTRLPDEGTHRAFARKLDATESVFFWEGEFAGNTDLVDRITIHLEPSLRIDDPTADAARFRDIWLAMKCRFPLLAARVDELDDGRLLRLVVSEERLANIAGPDEFEYIADAEVAKRDAVFEVGMNSLNRRISPSYPSAISILRCKDAPEGTYEIVTVTAHMLSDTMANLTYARALCDVISRWPALLADSNPPLEDALRMVVASESLYPTRRFSLARQRWRKATARIINAKRRAVLASGHAQLGGQTLPRKITLKTPYTPAITTNLWSPLPVAVSRAVIAACREHRVTVGNTLPVIAQIALSRVLHRRLARGEISREEWDRRIRSSMTTFGPGNTRPLLNPEWIKRGGFEVLNCSVNVYYEKLPFLPRAPLRDPAHETSFTVDDSGAPPLEALLSRAQFWHRVGLCKRTASEIKCHPLYFELGADKAADRAALARTKSKTWRRLRAGERVDLPPLDPDLLVPTYFGTSVGDIERAVPAEYPLRRSANEQQTLHRSLFPIATDLRLRLRPAQIYVGTASAGGVLNYWIFWDANVYEEALVKEWLDELLAAVTHFVRPEKQPSVTTAPTLLATRL